MLGGDAAALGFGEQAPLGDAEQRIMRLVHFRLGEETFIGRHQGYACSFGKGDQARLHGAFGGKKMPLQFHHETITKGLEQPVEQIGRLALLRFA